MYLFQNGSSNKISWQLIIILVSRCVEKHIFVDFFSLIAFPKNVCAEISQICYLLFPVIDYAIFFIWRAINLSKYFYNA